MVSLDSNYDKEDGFLCIDLQKASVTLAPTEVAVGHETCKRKNTSKVERFVKKTKIGLSSLHSHYFSFII